MTGKWDIRRIYLYLVSFATLMMMIFGTVQFLQGVINVAYPHPGPSPSEIKMRMGPDGQPKLTEAEIKKQMEEERASQRYYERRSMINNLVLFLVALPVYLYHWRKIQKSEVQLN